MDEFMKVAITACIPALTVIFGWGINKAASIANSYVHNQFVQHCIQNAANAVSNAVSDINQTYVDSLKEQDKFERKRRNAPLPTLWQPLKSPSPTKRSCSSRRPLATWMPTSSR